MDHLIIRLKGQFFFFVCGCINMYSRRNKMILTHYKLIGRQLNSQFQWATSVKRIIYGKGKRVDITRTKGEVEESPVALNVQGRGSPTLTGPHSVQIIGFPTPLLLTALWTLDSLNFIRTLVICIIYWSPFVVSADNGNM